MDGVSVMLVFLEPCEVTTKDEVEREVATVRFVADGLYNCC
jgi:hypothetical protein